MLNNRMNRIDSEIQKHLASIISKFDDIEISTSLVSVMKVETFSDFSLSKIYVSVFGDENKKKRIVAKLNDNKKTIRYELAHKVKFKNIPDLVFIVDDVEERAERVMKLFDQIKTEKIENGVNEDND